MKDFWLTVNGIAGVTLLLFGALGGCLAAGAGCGASGFACGISIGFVGCVGAGVVAVAGAGAGVDVLLALLEELFSSGSSGVCLLCVEGAGPVCGGAGGCLSPGGPMGAGGC